VVPGVIAEFADLEDPGIVNELEVERLETAAVVKLEGISAPDSVEIATNVKNHLKLGKLILVDKRHFEF